jgi:hypothetical protein
MIFPLTKKRLKQQVRLFEGKSIYWQKQTAQLQKAQYKLREKYKALEDIIKNLELQINNLK